MKLRLDFLTSFSPAERTQFQLSQQSQSHRTLAVMHSKIAHRKPSLLKMIEELKRIENLVFNASKIKINNFSNEKECEEYYGANFILDKRNVKFRKAKITPKKVGQFVTLWKRNLNSQTEPYNVKDGFDFYIIVATENDQFGFFFFPKSILSVKQILTNYEKVGKRGFRIYPEWTKTENKQAGKTKSWQNEYFINLNNEVESIQKFNLIFTSN